MEVTEDGTRNGALSQRINSAMTSESEEFQLTLFKRREPESLNLIGNHNFRMVPEASNNPIAEKSTRRPVRMPQCQFLVSTATSDKPVIRKLLPSTTSNDAGRMMDFSHEHPRMHMAQFRAIATGFKGNPFKKRNFLPERVMRETIGPNSHN
jgi:hypothetical protein